MITYLILPSVFARGNTFVASGISACSEDNHWNKINSFFSRVVAGTNCCSVNVKDAGTVDIDVTQK